MAKAKGIQLDDVEIHLTFKRSNTPKFHKAYHGDPERRKNMIAKIVSDVYVKGEMSENQKEMFLEELKHCPIHNTLLHPPELEERIHIVEAEGALPSYA